MCQAGESVRSGRIEGIVARVTDVDICTLPMNEVQARVVQKGKERVRIDPSPRDVSLHPDMRVEIVVQVSLEDVPRPEIDHQPKQVTSCLVSIGLPANAEKVIRVGLHIMGLVPFGRKANVHAVLSVRISIVVLHRQPRLGIIALPRRTDLEAKAVSALGVHVVVDPLLDPTARTNLEVLPEGRRRHAASRGRVERLQLSDFARGADQQWLQDKLVSPPMHLTLSVLNLLPGSPLTNG